MKRAAVSRFLLYLTSVLSLGTLEEDLFHKETYMDMLPYSLDAPVLEATIKKIGETFRVGKKCEPLVIQTQNIMRQMRWGMHLGEPFFHSHVGFQEYSFHETFLMSLWMMDEALNREFLYNWELEYSGCRFEKIDIGMSHIYHFIVGVRKKGKEKRFENYHVKCMIWFDATELEWRAGYVHVRSLESLRHGRSEATVRYQCVHLNVSNSVYESNALLLFFQEFVLPQKKS